MNPARLLSITIDNTFPTAPDTPDLLTTSDTGTCAGCDTDNITSDTTPTFQINNVTNGLTVDLLRDSNPPTGTPVVVASGGATSTSIQLTDPSAPAGNYTYTSRQTNGIGNSTSSVSGLIVTIDTTAPAAPGTPDLTTDTGTCGVCGTDNITNTTGPSVRHREHHQRRYESNSTAAQLW